MSRQERNCAHGVGHPLPDVHGTDSIHGCDGCCGGDPDPAATPTILDDARRIVEDSRRNEYGEPLDNWTDTAAIWTTLPAGKAVTTSELNMSFVRPMSRKTANMVGRAETVHSGKQVGLSTIQITDQDGRMLAFGSSRCLIVDVPAKGEAGSRPSEGDHRSEPDPFRRPAPDDGYFSIDEIVNGVPIDLQRKTVAGERTFPVWRLTGYRPTVVEDGRVDATLPSVGWLSNGSAAIYGGVLAWASEFTMGAAVYSTLGAGDVFATLDMQIRFMRPALVGSGPLRLSASVRHRGRRLRVTSCDVDDAQGRRLAMATSSALVVEGGVRELVKGRLPEEILAEGPDRE